MDLLNTGGKALDLGTTDPWCNRCGNVLGLEWFTECGTCGKVLLCPECTALHKREMAEDEEALIDAEDHKPIRSRLDITPEQLDKAAQYLQAKYTSAIWDRSPPRMKGRYRQQVVEILEACGIEVRLNGQPPSA